MILLSKILSIYFYEYENNIDIFKNLNNKISSKNVGVNMGIISWIIIGALAGWLASIITGNNAKMGAGKNIIVGILGAFIGGFIMNLIGDVGFTGFNIWSLIVAVIGSVILLLIINAVTKNKT